MKINKNLIIKFATGLLTVSSLIGCSTDPNSNMDSTAPRTKCYSKLDNIDCQVDTAAVKESFYFNLDQAQKTNSKTDSLPKLAKRLKNGELKVKIEGNADERGNKNYNYKLSEKRAQFIANQLLDLGAPKDSLTIVSNGESKPLVTGHNETAWKANRRVDIKEVS